MMVEANGTKKGLPWKAFYFPGHLIISLFADPYKIAKKWFISIAKNRIKRKVAQLRLRDLPIPKFFGGEGGIRTHGGHRVHNGFRDRPIRPLWHLSGFRVKWHVPRFK
jgi:hypothetical protein